MSGDGDSASEKDLRTVFIRVSPEMHDALRMRARQEDRSIAATARVALYEYLERPPARDLTKPPPQLQEVEA